MWIFLRLLAGFERIINDGKIAIAKDEEAKVLIVVSIHHKQKKPSQFFEKAFDKVYMSFF